MDKKQAQNLIKTTFENSFDRTRFIFFIKNLLNTVTEAPFEYQGCYLPESFRQYISRYERIGKYNDDEKRIDILIVKLKKGASIERARTMQRNFIAGYLTGRYGSDKAKDAALVAFVSPTEVDWRFSLVKLDYRFEEGKKGRMKVIEEFTPARRWSFLVGKNEASHTAQSRLVPILIEDEQYPTLTRLEEAFDIEKVTREFFEKYRDLFLWTKEELDKVIRKDAKVKADFESKGVDSVNFAKKLMGQIVFLYFLQKKGWFGIARDVNWGGGSKRFLRELFAGEHGEYNNFYDNILEPLFYEALRIDRSHDYNYYSRFNCKIPFLNGGLFDPINNYDWVKTDVLLPDTLFSNKRKTRDGDIGDGILNVFDRYNFTVNEDEPLDKEVAIDPELLGKAYEKFNAIRPDNYDEYIKSLESGKKGAETKFNKQYGVYYTPREIVHYMCQQSLITYLATELGDKVSKKDIETLILTGEQLSESEAIALLKEQKIWEGKQKTAKNKPVLAESIRDNAYLIDKKLAEITVCDPAVGSGAFPVGMMSEIVKARNVLSIFLKDNGRTTYDFKRQCIERSLYAVDIDPGAVEIAKLRLWLSLIVDEDDIKDIKPLPNLAYKIVCGNTLLGFPDDWTSPISKEIENLKKQFFNETNPKRKNEIKKSIDGKILARYSSSHKYFGYQVNFDFKTAFSEVFHQKNGFDVVIANPPYVEHKKLREFSKTFKKLFRTYSGTSDLYVYFYEKGLNILRTKGIFTFISSNKFIKTSYGAKLRGLLANNNIHQIIDFTKVHVFDALVASCIVIAIKENISTSNIIVSFADDTIADFVNLSHFVRKYNLEVSHKNISDNIWQLEDSKKLKIKSKIELNSVRISQIKSINIYRGVTTGYNKAFIIEGQLRKKLIKEDSRNKEIIKPLLQGRNIRKWYYRKSDTFLLQTGYDIDIPKKYSHIFDHLSKFKHQLVKRDDQGKNWYNLRACTFYPEFEKEKIIWGLTADKWSFAYDDKGHCLPSNGYILTSSKISIKYILALLNSNLMKFYFGFIGIMTAGGAFTLKHETIRDLPVKDIKFTEQKPFIDFVNKVLVITRDNDNFDSPSKQAKVKEYERQIDQLVYKLYGLTEDEIKIVEGGKMS